MGSFFLLQLLQHSWLSGSQWSETGGGKAKRKQATSTSFLLCPGLSLQEENCPSLLHTHFETKGQAQPRDSSEEFLWLCFSRCSWVQGSQQAEHMGSKTTQLGSQSLSFPAVDLTMAPQTMWLCIRTSKWIETRPTKMPHTTDQSLGEQLRACSISLGVMGGPYRGLLMKS